MQPGTVWKIWLNNVHLNDRNSLFTYYHTPAFAVVAVDQVQDSDISMKQIVQQVNFHIKQRRIIHVSSSRVYTSEMNVSCQPLEWWFCYFLLFGGVARLSGQLCLVKIVYVHREWSPFVVCTLLSNDLNSRFFCRALWNPIDSFYRYDGLIISASLQVVFPVEISCLLLTNKSCIHKCYWRFHTEFKFITKKQ